MFDNFVIPFVAGTIFLFAVTGWKWARWLWKLSLEDKLSIGRGIFTSATWKAAWEAVMESLVHRKIFKVNPLLGFMHMSLALGWFLLIVVGWIEAAHVFDGNEGIHSHVFFRYFDPRSTHEAGDPLAFTMDLLLVLVLTGVTLAWIKRVRSKALGMKHATRHVAIDRIALISLWFIFPLRLIAESFMAAIKHNGSFLTGSIGNLIASNINLTAVENINGAAWWLYSFTLGVFFVAMPFSRYMHIFTEIPLIFLRRYKLRSSEHESSYDNFQIHACSRCGICLDPCQLQKDLGINNVQSVYFLRDRRYGRLNDEVRDNCLMCGLCESRCPVGIELNSLRLNSRTKRMDTPAATRYTYLNGTDRSAGRGPIGYFAGCMTLLTPTTMLSMERIFKAAGEDVWWADKEGGACCGRPLKLTGEVAAARKIMEYNKELFRKHNIKTIVTSCPVCLKVFKEDYGLKGIDILHHTEYILQMVEAGRLALTNMHPHTYTYHDPCELGRGAGIYDEPRKIIRRIGTLAEPRHTRQNALCCGSSLANTAIDDAEQLVLAGAMSLEFENTSADTIVTACPLCKKAIARTTRKPVADISQIVAANIV